MGDTFVAESSENTMLGNFLTISAFHRAGSDSFEIDDCSNAFGHHQNAYIVTQFSPDTFRVNGDDEPLVRKQTKKEGGEGDKKCKGYYDGKGKSGKSDKNHKDYYERILAHAKILFLRHDLVKQMEEDVFSDFVRRETRDNLGEEHYCTDPPPRLPTATDSPSASPTTKKPKKKNTKKSKDPPP